MKAARRIVVTILASAIVTFAASGQPAGELPDAFDDVDVVERLEEKIPLSLRFTDSEGAEVVLEEYFDGETPVILNFVYHDCPMLCSIVIDALTAGMRDIAWTAGSEFRVLTVSFSPTETSELAARQKAQYIERLNRPGAEDGWHFLTGNQPAIDALTEAVGFKYKWDPRIEQYAHPAVLVLLSGNGRVMRYLYGIEFPAFQLRTALIETSEGKVGNALERFIVSCYQYDPDAESYTPNIMRIARLAGGAFALVLGIALAVLWRAETRKHVRSSPSPGTKDERSEEL